MNIEWAVAAVVLGVLAWDGFRRFINMSEQRWAVNARVDRLQDDLHDARKTLSKWLGDHVDSTRSTLTSMSITVDSLAQSRIRDVEQIKEVSANVKQVHSDLADLTQRTNQEMQRLAGKQSVQQAQTLAPIINTKGMTPW